jgi:hypothetical protein
MDIVIGLLVLGLAVGVAYFIRAKKKAGKKPRYNGPVGEFPDPNDR